MRRVVIGLIAAALAAAPPADAQTTDLTGQVRDQSGKALPGVIVEASRPELMDCVRSVTTGADGRYQFLDLPLGTYKLAFTRPGSSAVEPSDRPLPARPAFTNMKEAAEQISETIQRQHLLYGFISETQFETPTSTKVCWTLGNGDGALWTGNYLAAEAFRYKVTKSSQARQYLVDALERVRDLAFVSPNGFIARTIFPLDSPFIDRFVHDEARLGLFPVDYRGKKSYWLGWPTRDQYSGVFLGLAVTYDLIDDAAIRRICRETIMHLVDALIEHKWKTSNPDGQHRESFTLYRFQRLSVLQLAKHVDPTKYSRLYDRERSSFLSRLGWLSIRFDILTLRKKYYKLNLDYSYFYNLLKYEDVPRYKKRYLNQLAALRKATRRHGNALFNMIDRALTGPDEHRDRETVALLKSLLQRGFRNLPVDLNKKYKACGKDEACDPVPVAERPYEDFLWQRSPFALKGDGDGSLEAAGIDFILPYWMAAYYGVVSPDEP